MQTLLAEKNRLRELIRIQRCGLDPVWKSQTSQLILARLQALPAFQRAGIVHTYVSLRHEVETHELIRQLLHLQKFVVVPKVEPNGELQQYFIKDFSDLQTGAYGILEPASDAHRASVAQFGLVVVPGLAFDRRGNRLGAGKGYYDRFLAQVQAPKIALAFAFQIFEEVPVEPHDQRVDLIVTEKEVIACS